MSWDYSPPKYMEQFPYISLKFGPSSTCPGMSPLLFHNSTGSNRCFKHPLLLIEVGRLTDGLVAGVSL